MYPKKNITALIKTTAPTLINKLKLTKWTINWVVEKDKKESLKGCTYYTESTKTASVHIFYNMCEGLEDCLSTILHELIHIRFAVFHKLISKSKQTQMNKLEERFVQDLESAYIQLVHVSLKITKN